VEIPGTPYLIFRRFLLKKDCINIDADSADNADIYGIFVFPAQPAQSASKYCRLNQRLKSISAKLKFTAL
jgi:hypothetical protein